MTWIYSMPLRNIILDVENLWVAGLKKNVLDSIIFKNELAN